MRALAKVVAGRRTKWAIVVLWIVLAALLAPLGAKLGDETDNETESFLPKSAESTQVVRLLEREFPSGQTASGIVVYRRAGGLDERDRARIAADARRIADAVPLAGPSAVPFTASRGLVSQDGDIAATTFTLPDDNERLSGWGTEVRDAIETGERDGLEVYLTGNVGFQADFEEVFKSLDAKLLLATVLLVLVLLGAIYRSPIVAVIPLVVTGFAYAIAQALIYLYARSGATVSENSTQILVVLLFGIGTDYCLLLVSRFREELQQVEDKHEAMARAVQRAGPAILASGTTVILALLVLLVAETGSVHSLGPVCAIGVACVLVAGLTLLPALLSISGRRGFWPRQKLVAYAPAAEVTQREGWWRRLGDRVLHRPAAALGATVAVFALGSLGLLAYKEDYSTSGFFKQATESADGYRVLESALPGGALAPTTVVVRRSGGAVTAADVERARGKLAGLAGVATITPQRARSRDGRSATFEVVFTGDPNNQAALRRVPRMRERLRDLGPGVSALVGAGSAINYDYNKASARDIKLIVPIALVVIALILALLLQALVAPLVLIASVVLSFFGTLGLSFLFFRYIDDQPGIDASLPTFAFIFLVALGIDYTIFLMSRTREEARTHGTREGMLRAISATGPVITSAGLILAGTFSVLLTLPVTFAFDIGFMVAVGILLDTFVVRTIMVPAAVELIGDRVWWPSTARGGSRVFGRSPDQAA